MTRSPGNIKKYLFFTLAILFAATFFGRENYRSVTKIDPEIFRNPIQMETADETQIEFEKNGYFYKVMPLYDYDIAGLVVHHLKYNSWYSLSRTDSVFPVDLCLMWGNNVRDGLYTDGSLTFSQDYRFCLYQYVGDLPLLDEEISNNHLLIRDDDLIKLAESLLAGDQVRIKGKLANVEVVPLDKTTKHEPGAFTWLTSVSRDDTDAGACETIYVDSIEILKKGHPTLNLLFFISGYGLIILLIISVLDLFRASPIRKV